MPHRFGLVVDLAPWPEPAGQASIDGLAAPLRDALGTVRTWRPVREEGDRKGDQAAFDPALGGVIVSGSMAMVDDEPDWAGTLATALDHWIAEGVPTLATCFGHQFAAHHLGGTLASYPRSRVGIAPFHVLEADDPLLAGVTPGDDMLWSHRDHVTTLPPALVRIAGSEACPVEAFRHRDRPFWGIQAHPESSATLARQIAKADEEEGTRLKTRPWRAYDTPAGAKILENFVSICVQGAERAQARPSS